MHSSYFNPLDAALAIPSKRIVDIFVFWFFNLRLDRASHQEIARLIVAIMAYNSAVDDKRMDVFNFHVENVRFPGIFDFRYFHLFHRLFAAHSREQQSRFVYLFTVNVFPQ